MTGVIAAFGNRPKKNSAKTVPSPIRSVTVRTTQGPAGQPGPWVVLTVTLANFCAHGLSAGQRDEYLG